MIKYVCDMCGKALLEDEDTRYVVRIEVYADYQDSDTDEYADQDSGYLDAVDEADGPYNDDDNDSFRFDLCPECRTRFLTDPLSKGHHRKIRFSEN